MNKILEQTKLPDCKIIKHLIQKLDEKKDCEFNFIFHLEELRKRISAEVSRINLLFPEYTPHDENYHLSKLFYIADELLEDDIIENMNIVELFTLSVSLYAHDWGMAISEDEKQYILSRIKNTNDIFLLDDEEVRFDVFCKGKRIKKQDITDTDWQDYIRETHAFRSGIRIKKYFESINSGIAEVASRLCEGHYVDFDVIDDPNSYPTDYSVLRETVNIKALAIYLRLVDLLDLGEDRTPYVLWKFVSPRNKYSKMEWSKHRALQPVSFSNYQKGRYIQIDGSTDSHNVYMSVLDLKRYVNDQFKQSNDLLNRMNHSYHKLNLSHIDWRIAARGFKPIPIQFEFDRMRMFEILGDEIYQNDGFVFIRELIQNAVDAIKIREEVLAQKGLQFNNGKIAIDISDYNDIYYCVSVIDNGIGMDEYIIRNYLSVAGKSYYNSKDFEREGFKMEPISRFGIGVLSCFMLSDYIEIITHREPYISNSAEKLKISIPSKENYFRIEEVQSSLEIGTSYHIYVLKEKLAEYKIKEFNVTDYIKEIAGFVEFPLEVTEFGVKTIITNPNNENNTESIHHSLSFDFPFESAIKPHNIKTAKKYFNERKISLKEDLKLDKLEGCITFLIPRSEDVDICNIGRSWPIHDVEVSSTLCKFDEDCRIQWNDRWSNYRPGFYKKKNKVLSLNQAESYSVFINGILLSNATPPEINKRDRKDSEYLFANNGFEESFLVPKLTVNVPKTSELKIDLARSTLKNNEHWDSQIWEAFFEYIKNNDAEIIKKQDKDKMYFQIGRLSTYYRITSKNILEKIFTDIKDIPIPFINKDCNLVFKTIDSDLDSLELRKPCDLMQSEIRLMIDSYFIKHNKQYEGILLKWKGEEVLALGSEKYRDTSLVSLKNINTTILTFLNKYLIASKLEFINSPLGSDFPWSQEVLILQKPLIEIDLLTLENSKLNIIDLSLEQFGFICRELKTLFYRLPNILEFSKPYSEKAFFSWSYLNRAHSFSNHFIRLLLEVYKIKKNEKFSAEIYGEIIDKINGLPFMDYSYNTEKYNLVEINKKIEALNDFCSKENVTDIKLQLININDFITNSIAAEAQIISRQTYDKYQDVNVEWGELQ